MKKNQKKLHQAIEQATKTKAQDAYSWKQKGHGHPSSCRIKTWQASTEMKQQWKGLWSFICVTRKGVRNGKYFCSETYYITSQNKSAYRLSKDIRGHRKIENNLHWTKDVVLNEDNCQISDLNQASNLAILRNFGFNLLVMEGFNSITEGISQMGENIHKLWDIIQAPFKNLF